MLVLFCLYVLPEVLREYIVFFLCVVAAHPEL